METQLWILSGLTAVFFLILWWSVRRWMTQIDAKFDKLIEGVQQLGVKDARQEEQIIHLKRHNENQDRRLNDHAHRIRELEKYSYKHGK